jgi:hypothetical protein
MAITLQTRFGVPDLAQKLLFSSSDPVGKSGVLGQEHQAAGVFPGGSFRSDLTVARRLAFLDGRQNRINVQDLLRQENAFAQLTPAQRTNLEAAGSDRAVFILTGQQPGLFGGPILWYYKALTCAALARECSARLSRPVIPIFWVAGDDTDLPESNHIELLDAGASQVSGPLSLNFPDEKRLIPMSQRRLDPGGLAALLARLTSIWNSETVDALRRCYPVPSTLTSGFLRLAQSQLGREGILFVDGYSNNLRTLARPVLEHAILHWDDYQRELLKGTEVAEAAGIKTQVNLREGTVHAFALSSGERQRLYGEHRSGANRIYTAEQPEKNLSSELAALELTHDVFTRPLIADRIFPVLGHVLGPAELRYFAQMSSLFMETTGDMPLLHPRMTAAVAPVSAWEDFQNADLDIFDMVKLKPSGLRTKLEDRIWRAHPAATATSATAGENWVEGLRQIQNHYFTDSGPLKVFENSLGQAWKRYLRSLERMAFAGASAYHAKLFAHLHWLGGGMGQDRHLNLPSLLNVLGKDGMLSLSAAADPVNPDLHVFLYS